MLKNQHFVPFSQIFPHIFQSPRQTLVGCCECLICLRGWKSRLFALPKINSWNSAPEADNLLCCMHLLSQACLRRLLLRWNLELHNTSVLARPAVSFEEQCEHVWIEDASRIYSNEAVAMRFEHFSVSELRRGKVAKRTMNVFGKSCLLGAVAELFTRGQRHVKIKRSFANHARTEVQKDP